jgi:hypothetical protein
MSSQYKNFKRNLGTVSHGTMREEDLIPTFIEEFNRQSPRLRSHRTTVSRINKASQRKGYFNTDEPIEDLNILFDILDHYTLPGFYFGSHPGDGSDYGYWLIDSFQEEFDGLEVSDLSEVPTGYSGEVLHVNDHGNMSLYYYSRGKGTEVWGIV